MKHRSAKLSELASIANCERVGEDIAVNALGFASSVSMYDKMLTYCSEERYLREAFANDRVKAVIASGDLLNETEVPPSVSFLVSHEPASSFYKIHNFLCGETDFYRNRAVEEPVIGNGSLIKPTAVVEDGVEIGNNVRIESYSVIRAGTVIADDVVIESGTVIGVEGFEAKMMDGKYKHIRHAGGVQLRAGAWVGANTVIARSLFEGDTVIGENTQVDSMVHISHNVSIGADCLICSGTNLAGSVRVGDSCFLGLGSIVSNGVRIANRTKANIGAVVVADTQEGQTVSGFYAIDERDWLTKIVREKKMATESKKP